MVQGDPENIDAQYRTEYSIKALTDAGVEVDELLLQRGDWDQAKGQQIVQDALTQYGDDVEVVFCNNDAMALGALQAIQAAGRTVGKDIYLVGVDALTDAVQNIVDGKLHRYSIQRLLQHRLRVLLTLQLNSSKVRKLIL